TSTMRRRSTRSDSTPAYRPNTNEGAQRISAANATRNALPVSDATSSGPAAPAMPSPRLLIHDDETSHRYDEPRRRGTTSSSNLLTNSAPYVSLPGRRSLFIRRYGTGMATL